MSFGSYVRDLRTAAGLSQRALAGRLGVSHVYLGEVERGKRDHLIRERWPVLVEIGADPKVLEALGRPEVDRLREEVTVLRERLAALVGENAAHGV